LCDVAGFFILTKTIRPVVFYKTPQVFFFYIKNQGRNFKIKNDRKMGRGKISKFYEMFKKEESVRIPKTNIVLQIGDQV